MNSSRKLVFAIVLLTFLGPLSSRLALGADKLQVHEWGTFTSLQDENGRALSGINVDDEPVPSFVHNLHPYLLDKPLLSNQHWIHRRKATPRRHPLVTMRLETPIIYIYPPDNAKTPLTLDIDVRFKGGWLTEFYPKATAKAPGLKQGDFRFGELTSQTESRLTWNQVQVGNRGQYPQTDAEVWLAPRRTTSAPLTVGNESEQYIFYRGVAKLDSPLRVTTDRESQKLKLFPNFADVLTANTSAKIPALWLAHIREDGTSAFRTLNAVTVSGDPQQQLTTTSYTFSKTAYSKKNLSEMKAEMHSALVEDGLFDDEAVALLTTWQRAYFTSPGLRLFFLVPRVWTDHYMPLSISQPADTQRVMVGRIELITDQQRELLGKLKNGTISDGSWLRKIPESSAKARLLEGRHDFGELGVDIPADFQAYLNLGRFRNALIVDEEQRTKSANLTHFINVNVLQPFRVR